MGRDGGLVGLPILWMFLHRRQSTSVVVISEVTGQQYYFVSTKKEKIGFGELLSIYSHYLELLYSVNNDISNSKLSYSYLSMITYAGKYLFIYEWKHWFQKLCFIFNWHYPIFSTLKYFESLFCYLSENVMICQ